ncbi:hypothetical protein [Microbacterium sp. zg.Y909]|uniref:hypothetical protein n=1 Tax=Microbacterium sp. zg.Y909 TaxID=2969413 RepID=UPI00214AF5E0|nr:hypothetical protein [Microbacterium sp. zg.Y909]MCR2824235.1 hypothetical protein [Microbacterium sp. zg.Y909]
MLGSSAALTPAAVAATGVSGITVTPPKKAWARSIDAIPESGGFATSRRNVYVQRNNVTEEQYEAWVGPEGSRTKALAAARRWSPEWSMTSTSTHSSTRRATRTARRAPHPYVLRTPRRWRRVTARFW